MKFATAIRILLVLFIALGFINQHTNLTVWSDSAREEMADRPATAGNLASHDLLDLQHGDDIATAIPVTTGPLVFILIDSFTFPVPVPILTESSPRWQPPEFQS